MVEYAIVSIIIGLFPLILLLITVVILLKRLTKMIIVAWMLQAAVAIIYFRISFENVLLPSLYNIVQLWFWYYFIFVGIFLADLIMHSGAGRKFVDLLYRLEPNKYVLAVVLAGSLSSLLTSIGGGLGMPLTIPVTIYLLGMDPIVACAGMVTAFAWSMSYSGWGATATTLLLAVPHLPASAFAFWGSLLLIFPTIMTQLISLHTYGGSIRKNVGPMVAVSGAAIVGFLIASQLDFRLVSILASGFMLIGLFAYSFLKGRVRKTPNVRPNDPELPNDSFRISSSKMGSLRSWLPIILLIIIGTVWFYSPLSRSLESITYSLFFPSLPPTITEPIQFDLLGTQGTLILIVVFFTWFLYQTRVKDLKHLLRGTFNKWWPMALVTGVGAAISGVFEQSGVGALIVNGLVGLPGPVVAFLTPWLGAFGAMTVGGGAPTNFLFGPLVWNTFTELGRNASFYTSIINTTGNGFAYSLSPAYIIGAVAIAGIIGKEGQVWRKLAGSIFLLVFLFSIEVLVLYFIGL